MAESLSELNRKPERGGKQHFTATMWTEVLNASRGGEETALDARNRLCQTYWYPVYAFLRRKGSLPGEAADLTQEFLAEVTTPENLARADRTKGRFRTYLLGALDKHLANQWDKLNAQKRKPANGIVSIDEQDAEGQYLHEPTTNETPDKLFDRIWALTVLQQAMRELERDYSKRGKADIFQQLRIFIEDDKGTISYEQAAQQCNISLSAVKTAILRLRRDYGVAIKQVLSETVSSEQDSEEELAALFGALGSN
jgi:RNA polymerase sigma-70 factor (ECF subfamily)